jgi:crotonobetainyl-CoA:carnitine CoA-transferase CaiB-like acyl-CoA transferase
MSGPLTGFRIVDVTAMLSGPYCTMILGDQGADVIKVEPPGTGDHVRSLGNRSGGMSSSLLNTNRSKRSVTIDLKSPAGLALMKRLIKTADVFVQNFRPGVAERLGLGYEALREIAPKLVYVSISGFGEAGPYAVRPTYDPIIQAFSGLTTVQAGSDAERPRLIRTVLSDKLTAITASQAVTAALLARERQGVGQHVRLSMLDAVMAFLWASDMGAQTYVGREVTQQAAASFIDLIYETRDGYITVAVMSNKEWQGLTRALEKPEWLTDPRFADPQARDRNINDRLAVTQEVLKTRTTAEWLKRLEAESVPCGPVHTRSQVIDHPQVQASGILIETDHPVAGRLRQTRPAARFEKTPPTIRRGAPRLGEHTDEVLAEIGVTDAELAAARQTGAIGSEMLEASAERPRKVRAAKG